MGLKCQVRIWQELSKDLIKSQEDRSGCRLESTPAGEVSESGGQGYNESASDGGGSGQRLSAPLQGRTVRSGCSRDPTCKGESAGPADGRDGGGGGLLQNVGLRNWINGGTICQEGGHMGTGDYVLFNMPRRLPRSPTCFHQTRESNTVCCGGSIAVHVCIDEKAERLSQPCILPAQSTRLPRNHPPP